jgi:adenine-specific DNA methylase
MDLDEKFVEAKLPLSVLNKLSAKESGFIRVPKIHNIHTWFARRPAGAARVLTLASLLPEKVDEKVFLQASTLAEAEKTNKVIYMVNPRRIVVQKLLKERLRESVDKLTVLDPMAGGGSIPLESVRLGLRTVAMEYNPVAYLILKATVEFPAKYADSDLFEETLKVSKEFIDKAKKELERFYGSNAKRYVFARGVNCPFCGGLIPVQGIDPAITKAGRFKKRFLKITYDKKEGMFSAKTTDKPIESGSIVKRGNNVLCPYCNKWFQLRGVAKTGTTAFDKWFKEHTQLLQNVIERFTPVTSEIEEKLLKLHIPLVKQVGNEFYAIWDDADERRKFVDALRTVSNELFELQDYIPLDGISPENRWASTARNKNLTKWYMLFNPRQLLAITKLSRLIAETAEKLVSKNGEFGTAIATYLALALDKLVDYNTIATKWQGSTFKTGIGNTLRGESTIDFRREYCEMGFFPPELSLGWALEPVVAESNHLTKTAGGILPVLRFLCDEFHGSKFDDRINIYLGDATQLSNILGQKSVDILNVDPPYFEQVIYSDRSEFFWVILRRALAPVLEMLFKPGLKLSNWSWTNPTVPREREVIAYDKEDRDGRFGKFFKEFTSETSKILKDDGVLVLWFTHPTAEAWRVVSSSLYDAGYVVPKVWPLQTEMKTRYKKQVNIVAQEMSLIIVGRKYNRQKLVEVSPEDVKGSVIENPLFTKTVKETVEDTRKIITQSGASPADTAALMFGTALSVASRFTLPVRGKFSDLYDAAITAVVSRYVQPLIYKVLTETGPIKLDQTSAQKVVKHVAQGMLIDPATRSYLTLWLISRVDLATGKIRQEPLGLHFDLVQTVGKLCGFGIENLNEYGLITAKTINKTGKAYFPQFLEILTLAGAKVFLEKLLEVAPGRATILARQALTESGDPSTRAKAIRAKTAMVSDRELASNAALATVLLNTIQDKELGYRIADKRKISAWFPGVDESQIAKVVRELSIKTLTQLIF